MKHTALYIIFAVLAFAGITACSDTASTSTGSSEARQFAKAEGDSTIYGITAEGTNDSILVYLALPYSGADPDTVSILDALRSRKVFGRPNTGDNVAVLRSAEDSTKAERVIMLQDLLGKWCYEVYPTLRRTPVSESQLPQILKDMLQVPREYTLMLKNDYTAYNMAERGHADDEQIPIVYPKARRYTQWQIFNGRLVFTETTRDSLDNRQVVGTDTADIIRLRRDTLQLQFADSIHTYYRKNSEE